MEYKKLIDDKGSSKRDHRSPRARTNQRLLMRYNLIESTGQAHNVGGMASCVNENGRLQMRVILRSHELKHLMDVMKNVHKAESTPNNSPSTLEQRLQFMRRRHLRRADSMKERCCPWKPVLQSIPEEL
ncbi:hypothetical protein Syun_005501 [Stephania yunnanensis]|uniref:Uncharacterized protein n=1 Tax=Stephania yunnanensis TaxID=152371 RepID=A0AAP0L8J7_9MAGN